MPITSLLRLTADPNGPDTANKIDAFVLFLAFHVAARACAVLDWQAPSTAELVQAIGLTGCFLVVAVGLLWIRRRDVVRMAFAAALALHVVRLVTSMPTTSNHFFVETLLVFLATFCKLDDDAEQDLFLEVVRWLTAIVLFYSGFQKLLYGTYFHGQFLAFAVAQVDSFRDTLGHLLSADELARLHAYDPLDPSASYQVSSLLFVVAANGAWVGEMALGAGLLVARVRRVALVGAIVLVVGIEICAREVLFGVLFLQLLLLFARRPWNRATLPAVAAFYIYLLLMRAGVLPAWSFTN